MLQVKPTQQVSGTGNQTVLNSTSHQQHSAMVAQSLMGNPLSPPPMPHVPGAGVGLGQPQPYSANQHLGYQVINTHLPSLIVITKLFEFVSGWTWW